MTTKIEKDMVGGSMGAIEQGDLTWSARTSKVGWLVCQGQAISRTVYTALFLAIGTAFGVGDGSTTFNLPDGRGRAMIGVGTGPTLSARAMGDKGGAETHTLAAAEIPEHSHPIASGGPANGTGSSTNFWQGPGPSSGMNTQNNTGGGGAHNNMQPFLAANLFIYAGV